MTSSKADLVTSLERDLLLMLLMMMMMMMETVALMRMQSFLPLAQTNLVVRVRQGEKKCLRKCFSDFPTRAKKRFLDSALYIILNFKTYYGGMSSFLQGERLANCQNIGKPNLQILCIEKSMSE